MFRGIQNTIRMRIIQIDYGVLIFFYNFELTTEIIFKVRMFVWADMVIRNIDKYSVIKFNPVTTIHLIRLRSYLHHESITAAVSGRADDAMTFQ